MFHLLGLDLKFHGPSFLKVLVGHASSKLTLELLVVRDHCVHEKGVELVDFLDVVELLVRVERIDLGQDLVLLLQPRVGALWLWTGVN